MASGHRLTRLRTSEPNSLQMLLAGQAAPPLATEGQSCYSDMLILELAEQMAAFSTAGP